MLYDLKYGIVTPIQSKPLYSVRGKVDSTVVLGYDQVNLFHNDLSNMNYNIHIVHTSLFTSARAHTNAHAHTHTHQPTYTPHKHARTHLPCVTVAIPIAQHNV